MIRIPVPICNETWRIHDSDSRPDPPMDPGTNMGSEQKLSTEDRSGRSERRIGTDRNGTGRIGTERSGTGRDGVVVAVVTNKQTYKQTRERTDGRWWGACFLGVLVICAVGFVCL
jgi:hypothetical protein